MRRTHRPQYGASQEANRKEINLSVSLRSTAPLIGEPLAKPETPSCCQSLPYKGRWHCGAMTERLYEGSVFQEPLVCLLEKSFAGESFRSGLTHFSFGGTGSYPQRPSGLQRAIRHAPSSRPLQQPWVWMASSVYWLHEGVKRQLRPRPGLIKPDGHAQRVPGELRKAHSFAFAAALRAGGTVAGAFAPGCFALSGRPACAKSLATTSLSCQLLRCGVMPRATKIRS